jgi:hypothetical protein
MTNFSDYGLLVVLCWAVMGGGAGLAASLVSGRLHAAVPTKSTGSVQPTMADRFDSRLHEILWVLLATDEGGSLR